MDNFNLFDENLIEEIKNNLKDKHLTKEQLKDAVFVEMLSKLDLEGRLRVMHACMFNDTFRRIRYRKTKA